MPWLIEVIGPQHSGKTTIADLLALTLEDNQIPALRVETDTYIQNLFPIYDKLKLTGKLEEAHRLIRSRWSLLHDVITTVIRKGLAGGFNVVHDHVNTGRFIRSIDKRIASKMKAEYLSVLVTAPVETLRERWHRSNISAVKLVRLEKMYLNFQRLQQETRFGITIDSSVTPPEEAVTSILTLILPDIDLKVEPERIEFREELMPLVEARPQSTVEGFHVIREGDAYFVVHKHARYLTDEVGLKILNLCNGKNTLERIAELAGTDLDTVRKDVEFLCGAEMATILPPDTSSSMLGKIDLDHSEDSESVLR